MKKRILMVLLVVALLVVAAAFTVQAEAPTPYDRTSTTQKCPHCNKVMSELTWTELTNDLTTFTTGAHYFVPEAGLTRTGSYWNINGRTFVILFEGTLTAKDGSQIFRFGMDKTYTTKAWLLGGEGGKITGTGTTSNGALIRVGAGGTVTIDGDLTIELSGSIAATKDTRGIIDVIGKLIMEDGTINGMTSTAADSVAQNGGAVYVFNSSSAKFTMNGGTITAGNIAGSGGAIYMATGTVELNGGTIETSANTGVDYGRAIMTSGGTLKIQDQAVVKETTTSTASLIYSSVNVEISGGHITGKVYVTSAGKLTISGNPVIDGTGVSVNNSTADITLGELTTTGDAPASIVLDVGDNSEGLALSVKNTDLTQDMAYCFDLDLVGRSVIAKDGVMYVTTREEHAKIMRFIADADGEVWAECPICKENVQWGAVTAATILAGANTNDNGSYTINASADSLTHFYFAEETVRLTTANRRIRLNGPQGHRTVCFNLNDATYSGANADGQMGMFLVSQNNTLNLMGDGTVIGNSGVENQQGSVKWIGGAAVDCRSKVNIYGGTYRSTATKPAISLFTNATGTDVREVNMYGGTIQGAEAADSGLYSAAVIVNSSTQKFNMYGGTITGGHATNGANVLVQNGTFNMEGGTITKGTATGNGGAVNVANTGTFNFKGGTISDCSANRGGAFYVEASAKVNMSGGKIEGCKVSDTTDRQGGVAFVVGAFNMSSGVVNVENFEISTSRGFRIQGGGELNLSGDAEIHGYGKHDRDIIDVVTTDSTNPATVTLADKATVVADLAEGGAEYSGVVFNSTAKLIVKEGWVGAMEFEHDGITDSPYGAFLEPALVAFEAAEPQVTTFTGKLTLSVEGKPTVTAKANPKAAVENEIQMIVSGTQIVTKDGATWYPTNDDAVDAYDGVAGDNKYIKLYADNSVLALDDTQAVNADLNGKTVAFTGPGKLSAFDSTATLVDPGNGKVTGDAPEAMNEVGNDRYVRLVNKEGDYTLHRYTLAITGVTVRPESAGMYYKATIECDPTLEGEITAYGVAVSVKEMPKQPNDATALYTAYTSGLESGVEFNGVLINNIMKIANDIDEEANDDRAQKNIYASAYFRVNGIDEAIMSNDGIFRNLKGLMHDIDGIYNTLNDRKQGALKDMYNTFKKVFEYGELEKPWNLTNIKAAYETAKPTT